jgi:hypothetical protein
VLACDPISAAQSAFVLSETLATLLLALSLLFAVRFARTLGLASLALSAAGLAAAVHVRPVFLNLAPVLVVLVAFRLLGGNRPRLVPALTVLALVLGAILGSWVVRNIRQVGYPGFSAVGDYALLFHAAGLEAETTGGDTDAIMERYRDELTQECPPDFKLMHQAEWYRTMRGKGWNELSGRLQAVPAYAVRQLLKVSTHVDHQSLEQVIGGIRTDAPEREAAPRGMAGRISALAASHPGILAAVLLQLGLVLVMWAGTTLALGWLWAERRSPVVLFQAGLLFATVILGLASGALPNAQVRFRLPLLPALLPLMAAGLAWFPAVRRRSA